jgi:lysophospholipase L1-like esterase
VEATGAVIAVSSPSAPSSRGPSRGDNYTILFAGDSIQQQAWFTAATNTIVAKFPGTTIVNSGSNGALVATIDAGYQGFIQQYAPTHMVLEIGANDVIGGTTPANFQTSYQSIVSKTRSMFPGCKITHCTLIYHLEDWPSGANPDDAAIELICTRIRTVQASDAASFPGLSNLLDFRAKMYTIQEPIANPTHLTTGVLSVDGIHPNAAGKVIASAQYLQDIPFP